MKKIMFIGPQGSGKTTQAKILAEKLGFKYLGTGEMFREILEKKEEGWEKIKVILEGKLVNDEITCNFVKNRLEGLNNEKGIIIDGYPRNVEQKNIFDPDFDIIIYIKVSDEVAVSRLLGRGRIDDTVEAIKKRLELYHLETGPLLDVFLNEGKLWIVDGEKSIESVTEQIFKHLNLTT